MSIRASMDDDDMISLNPDMGRSRIESVSRVAIRNIKPQNVDLNDPDQRQLIQNLNQMEAKIWGYSDNQPAFIAKLNKNNPGIQRKAIETMVNMESASNTTRHPKKLGRLTITTSRHNPQNKNNKILDQSPATRLSTRIFETESMEQEPKKQSLPSDGLTDLIIPVEHRKEIKMIIKKTIELVIDMNKSVEFVFHATRATARFLTYPTPSVPSDNYVFGHAKGWIWLIYKGLSHFDPKTLSESKLKELLKNLRHKMSRLAQQCQELTDNFSKFHRDLSNLHASIKKEAKFLKSQSTLWSLRMDGYFKYAEDLKARQDLLLDIKEDRPFSSDWAFYPDPSLADEQSNFFHFQWIKTKTAWETDDFEIRSDYSNRWHQFSTFNSEQQMEIIFKLIVHLTAMLEEASNFVKINMKLTFDFDEIKCLRFAVAEINSVKKNHRTAEYIGDMTRKLFEDMALVEEISKEFMHQLQWMVNIIAPCYESIKKQLDKGKMDHSLQPLEFGRGRRDFRRVKNIRLCCGCFLKSRVDFLQGYGQPMQAVFLRTPISDDVVALYFPKENLALHLDGLSNRINQYGISEGYVSSIFDHSMGREAPTKVPKRLPRVRRKSLFQDLGFSPHILIEMTGKSLRPVKKDDPDGPHELDTEMFLQNFSQIKKFFLAFGSMFNFMQSEVTERLENLENRLFSEETAEKYETLEKLIRYEKYTRLIETDPLTCGTRSFQRLLTVFLFFILFLENLSKLDEFEATSYACKSAYYKSCAKYHSWFVQKTSMFSIYSIPNKTIFYQKLVPQLEIKQVDDLFMEFVTKANLVHQHCLNSFQKENIIIDL